MIVFAINSLWQIPLLAGAGWLFLRLARVSAAAEYRLWVGILVSNLVLAGAAARQPTDMAPHLDRAILQLPYISAKQLPLHPLATEAPGAKYVGIVRSPAIAFPRLTVPYRRSLGWIYACVIAVGALRVVRSYLAARGLLNSSQPLALSEDEVLLWAECLSAMKTRSARVSLRRSDLIPGPCVLGAYRSTILLPGAFHLLSATEQRAALCHELAHIRRGDYLIHTVCEILVLPVVWHPAAHFIQRQIARTREMACDALAARAMRSDQAYARSLLRLAQSMMGIGDACPAGPGLRLFHTNKLEERIMRLAEVNPTRPGLTRWMLRATGGAGLAAALAVVSIVHVKPLPAQEESARTLPSVSQATAPAGPAPQPSNAGVQTGKEAKRQAKARGGQDSRHKASARDSSTLSNDQAMSQSPEQKEQAEAESLQKLNGLDQGLATTNLELVNPQLKGQIDQLARDLSKQQLVDQKRLAEQLAVLNSKEWQAKTKKQIEGAMAQLNGADFNKKLNDAMLQAQILSSPEMDRRMADAERRMNEASKQLEEATRALEQARRQLEQQRQK